MERREIVLENGDRYFYTISTYNAENFLGVIKATLKQFTVHKTNTSGDTICTLYQTDEGNWYDLIQSNAINPFLLTSIKMAIDKSE